MSSPASPQNDYEFKEVIGTGAFSTVYRARNRVTQVNTAIKVIRKAEIKTEHDISRVKTELAILKKLDHPHIIHFYDAYEDNGYLYFVMELGDEGVFLEHLNKGPVSERTARMVINQLISALEYLHHDLHILHRDLKLENIILDHNRNVRLTDFGLSSFFDTENPFLSSPVGSPAYAAPEIIHRRPYSTPVDIWGLGISLYTMVAGHFPFFASNNQDLAKKIAYQEPDYPESFSPYLTDLLTHILAKDPSKRFTLNQILHHPWMGNTYLRCSKTMRFRVDGSLDQRIVEKMKQLGIECSQLDDDLTRAAINRNIAIYRILRTELITKELKQTRRKELVMESSYFGRPFFERTKSEALVQSSPRKSAKISLKNRKCIPSLVIYA